MPNLYATLDMLKAKIADTGTSNDDTLAFSLEWASRHVDELCGRTFFTNRRTEFLDIIRLGGGQRGEILLPDELQSCESLTFDEGHDGTFSQAWTEGTDFWLWPYENDAPTDPTASVRSMPATAIVATGRNYRLPAQNDAYWDAEEYRRVPLLGPPVAKRYGRLRGIWGHGDGTASPWEDSGTTGTVATAGGKVLTLGQVTGTPASPLVGQTVRVGSEQMYVVGPITDGVAGVAGHDAVPAIPAVAPTATVQRGVNGTVAAAHATAATLYVALYPIQVVRATIILAKWDFEQQGAKTMAGETAGDYSYRQFLPQQMDQLKRRLMGGFVREVLA